MLGTSGANQRLPQSGVCLHRGTYSYDVMCKELALLPELQNGIDQELRQVGIGGSKGVFECVQLVGASTEVSDAGGLVFLLQSSDNQLQAVRAICSNAHSKELLLVLWILFSVCAQGLLCLYACFLCAQAVFGCWVVVKGLASRMWARVQHIAVVSYQTCAGLGGLALYYCDLVSSIVVLTQIWGSWLAAILLAISYVHFAVTAAVVAVHAINKLLDVRYILYRNKPRT